MITITQTTAYFRARPILVGLLTVLVTTGIGASIAISTGFVDPSSVFASGNPTCTLAVDEVDEAALDYDDDGELTSDDAQYLLRVAVGSETCPSGKICDINGDGVVRTENEESSLDAQMLLVYVTNKLPTSGLYTLSWTSNNATGMSIDNGIGAVIPIVLGHVGVSPTETTTYTGTATGPGGSGTCSATITITPPGAPDLQGGYINEITARAGTPKDFTSTITNVGTEPAVSLLGDIYNRFQITEGPLDSNGDTTTAVTDIPNDVPVSGPLAPAAPQTGPVVTKTYTFSPSDIGSSVVVRYMRVCADSPDSVVESDEDNNCGAWKPIQVAPAETTASSDLVASVVSPTTATAGVAKTFSATISNNGGAATGAPFYTLVQRTNAVDAEGNATGSVIMIDTLGTNPLSAGQSTVKSVSYTFPSADNGTTRYLRFCADKTQLGPADGDIEESDETNNCGPWTAITVGTPTNPDLVASVVSPTTATAGVAKTFSATISNNGGAATGAPFYTLVQRTNAVDAEGNATGSVIMIDTLGTNPLSAGQSTVKSVSYTFPSADNGTTRYLRFCADKTQLGPADGDIEESDETNNCGPWTAITVGTPPVATCTYTQGYWKTHNASFTGGAPANPTWNSVGTLKEQTPFYQSDNTWFGVFWTQPAGNAYYTLAHQYMAAKLNVLRGAPMPSNVTTAFNTATTLLSSTAPDGNTSGDQWTQLAGLLGSYNEGNQGVPHCSEPQPPQPVAPTCTLTVTPGSITAGGSATLAWSTTGAAAFSINQNIGAVSTIPGSRSVSPNVTTTYTGTVTGPGGTANCNVTLTVTPTDNPAPTCALVATPGAIDSGESSSLTWSTTRATSFSINQGIGAVATTSGTRTVSPTATTTYTGTVTGPGGTVNCATTIDVAPPPPPPAPTCTLAATPSQVDSGGRSVLSWTTANGAAFSINQGIGGVSPLAAGTTSTAVLTQDTTFTGTITSASGQTATCSTQVTIKTGGGGGNNPTCSLTVSPSSYREDSGDSATLSWNGSNVTAVDIDNGIATNASIPGSVRVNPSGEGTYTYRGTFRAANGTTVNCSATLEVTRRSSGGSSRSSSGSRPNPSVLVSSVAHAGQVAGEYVYLSQMPYTGLDLGPAGSLVYWVLLIGWSALLAYIVLFNGVPALRRSLIDFGGQVQMILNTPTAGGAAAMPLPSVPMAPVMRQTMTEQEDTRGYSAYEGFKSFAKQETLSIEDIVKGLARTHKIPSAAPQPAAMQAHTEPIYENVEPIEAVPAQTITEHVAEASGISTDVRGFTYALLEGDREGTFAGLRQYARGGGKPETLISQAAFLIDDAYRARVEGAECDADIVRHAARLSTPQLEKLVISLTTAIDSSYSAGIAGAKLALTRALAVLGA